MTERHFLPVVLNLQGRPVLVVGGGTVAARKCRSAIAAGGRVTVVAPVLIPALAEQFAAGRIEHWNRPFAAGDTRGFFLVFAATDDPDVNGVVAAEALSHRALVEVVDNPIAGTITSPAVVSRGDLQIAVSTGGASPLLARRVRDEIAGRYGDEYGTVLEILRAVRRKLLTETPKRAYYKRIFEQLAASELPRYCRDGDFAAIDRLLGDIAGNGYSLAELGFPAKDLS